MRRNKRKIIAMLLFVFMSLFMFAFANPDGEIELELLKPVMTLDENNPYQMEVHSAIPEFKAIAKDASGNDLEVNITHNINNSVVGTYKITFKAKDNFDNEEVIEREFRVVDTTRPVITLIGRPLVKRLIGYETYTDQGANVTDNYDEATIIYGVQRGANNIVGTYTLRYNHTDNNGNSAFEVVRAIKMLAHGADEDGDGYTNLEEYEAGTDYDDPNDYPDYDKAPTIILDESNVYEMVVYDEVPEFKANATDVADGIVPVVITHNIKPDVVGTYEITFRAVDSLGNEKVLTKEFKVIKRNITVKIDNKTSVYKNPIVELTYTVTSGVEVSTNAEIILSTTATSTSNVGDYPITGTYTNGNYDVTFVDGTYTITKKEIKEDDLGSEFSFTDKSYVYDKTEKEIKVSGLPSDLEVEYDNNKRTNEGEQLVKATITGENYTGEITKTATLEVTKAKVTYTIDNKTSVYKNSIVELTGSVTSGTVYEGDNLNVNLSTTATSTSNVGDYPITGTYTNGNYDVTFVDGTYTITVKNLTDEDLGSEFSFTNKSYVYDKTEKEIKVSGLPSDLEVEYDNNKRTNVGEQLVKATITGANYTGSLTRTATLEVTKASLTFKAEDKTSVYKDSIVGLTYTTTGTNYDGIVPVLSTTATSTSPVGTYPITITASNDNYTITLVNGTYTITVKNLTDEDLGSEFSFTNKSYVYDKTEKEIKVSGLPSDLEVEYDNNKRTNEGEQLVKATITGANYTGSITKTATLEVTKAEVTYTIDNKTSVYKNSIVELTGSVTSGTVYEGDNLNVNLSTTATSTSNVGDYPITGTYTNGNYDVTFVDGTYTITKKEIKEDDLGSEFSFTDKSYVYDKTEKEIKVSGLPSDLEVEYDNNKRTNEGEQLVKATITGENYTGEITKTATLEVTKAKVTYTIDNKKSQYKSPLVELTGSVTSGTVYEGDDLGITLSTNATPTSNVLPYLYTIWGTSTNTNYDVLIPNAFYEITAKPIEDSDLGNNFKFENKSYVYDKTEKEIKVSGLPSDLEVEYDNNKRTNVGEQLVKATITGANYTGLLTRTATLEVTKASLTFKAEDKTSVYKDSIVGLTYTTTGTNYDGIVPVLSTTATSTSPVGTYPITITASNDNYTITLVNGTYTITAKELTEDELNKLNVKFENKTVDYDGNEHEILVQNKPDWATVEYNNNKGTNVDTYEATAKITGNGNYTGTVTLSAILKINPINPTYEIPTGLIGVKNNKLSTVSLPSGWSWNSPNTEMEIVGNQTFAATFTPVDTQNYNTVTKDLTVYVKDIFTVNFIVDGLTIDTQQVIEGENATAPENPSKAGYTFDGWDKVYTNVMTNLDVNAKWELITYNITYNLDGGSHTGNPTTYNITTPTIILKDASKTGHTFNGWYSENTFTNKVISIEQGTTGNITLYAKFTANQFTITFDSNGGTLVSSITQAYGTTITMPENPTKTNYEFVKWNPAVPETMPANDMTVVAEWKALQIGIVVKEKPNAQLVFTQGRPYNITEYINVYPKYADGTVGTEAIPTSDYTTDFSTTTPGNNKTLTVTQTSTEFVGTITYKVIADTAFQTKFEAKHNPSATGYYVTKRNNWGNYYCTSGCDSGNNVSFVSTTDKILEVIEHYDEKIAVESVKIKYVGDNNYGNSLTPIKNGSYSFVRYSKLSGGSYYDPVRVYKIHDTKTIDLVQVIYERTFSANDKRRFVIIFKYESAGNLEAISEQQL